MLDIINLRGGSGAGKSTIIRKIRAMFPSVTPQFVENRRQPLFYDMVRGALKVRLLGHYEVECGGCDTISKNPNDPNEEAMAFIHRLVREAHSDGWNVLYEGVILSTINTHLLQMVRDGLPITVVNLTSDLETCLMGIAERRARKIAGENPCTPADVLGSRKALTQVTIKNNLGKLKSAIKTSHQLRAAGARVVDLNRETAVDFIVQRWGLDS